MLAVRRRRNRPFAAIACLTVLAALATACSTEDADRAEDTSDMALTSSPSPDPELAALAAGSALNDTEAQVAVLTKENLGTGFEADEVDEPAPPDGMTGCESEVAFDDRLDPEGTAAADAEGEYYLFDETRILVVSSHVTSFGDEDAASEAFEGLVDNLGGCTHLETTDEGGTVVADFEIDDETSSSEVDAQFNMVGTGTASFGPDSEPFPLAASFSAARVDNNVTMTFLVGFGSAEDSELIGPYTDIAVDRLVAVASGQTPDDVTAPAPGSRGLLLPDELSESLEDLGDELAPEELLGDISGS